jgi:alpha-beta hydrolase superfamily lysophospholipase
MKIPTLAVLLFLSFLSFADNFRGDWKGQGNCGDSIIQISFSVILQTDSMIGVFLYLPTNFTLADSSFSGSNIHLISSKLQLKNENDGLIKRQKAGEKVILFQEIKFDGKLTASKNELVGEFTYQGRIYQAQLYRGNQTAYRPQEPQKPYPYYCEDVTFKNVVDSVVLGATLTLPNKEGKFPAVIIQTGSTPLDRDGESNYHKPILLLADYLTRNGIAVLRYDSRGIGKSSGNFDKSTPVDLAGDLIAGYQYLASRKEINGQKIGIIGHSEGGMVAAIAASQLKEFDFVVMLAAPRIPFRDVFNMQRDIKFKNGDASEDQTVFFKKLDSEIENLLNQNLSSREIFNVLIESQYPEFELISAIPVDKIMKRIAFGEILNKFTCPHNLFNLKVNPADYIEKLTCPVLSLNGSNDMQVTAEINQNAIRKALIKSGNKDFKIVELSGLNHSFQEC